ncbi:MAG: glycogen-binding domain-containing protein [Planctomycetota bacterium]
MPARLLPERVFAPALLLLCLATPGLAFGVTDAEVNAAVEKARDHLLGRQDKATGAFKDVWEPKGYKSGETALTLLALLKAGVPPGDPRIEAGFAWFLQQPIERVYDVSVGILAIEARYMPAETKSIDDPAPLTTQVRRRFKQKAPPRDRDWLIKAAAFLEKYQDASGLWRYPFYGEADVSNTQFAVLALKAAHRLGVKVSPQPFWRAAEAMLKHQQQSGQKVSVFPVPAADRKIEGLLDKREQEKKKKKKEHGGGTRERDEETPTVTSTTRGMSARGWGYKPGDGPRGSMTAAGVAILVVCKSQLEEVKRYEKALADPVDQALRDGAAWLALHFAADKNPGAEPDWLFYYLYTLERAGTLLALERFGGRAWYEEGAKAILARQQQDGRFLATTQGQADGDLAGTCLALLFLKRSTVPVMKRVVTGGGDADPAAGQGGQGGGPTVKDLPDGSQEVTFRFRALPGRSVTVAGSFNGWDKAKHPLSDTGGGVYVGTFVLPKGEQQYKFVVDGQEWFTDPDNPRIQDDGKGNRNSLVGH